MRTWFFISMLIMAATMTKAASVGEVRGTVVLSPACPGPAQVGKRCSPVPIAAAIDVFRSPAYPSASDRPYRRVESNKQGQFRVSLSPGSYWFIAHVPRSSGGLSAGKPQQIEVKPGTAEITLVVDSGML